MLVLELWDSPSWMLGWIISPCVVVWLPVDDNDDMSLRGDYKVIAFITMINWFCNWFSSLVLIWLSLSSSIYPDSWFVFETALILVMLFHKLFPVGKIAKKQSENKIQCLKNTLLQTVFSAILPTGFRYLSEIVTWTILDNVLFVLVRISSSDVFFWMWMNCLLLGV